MNDIFDINNLDQTNKNIKEITKKPDSEFKNIKLSTNRYDHPKFSDFQPASSWITINFFF